MINICFNFYLLTNFLALDIHPKLLVYHYWIFFNWRASIIYGRAQFHFSPLKSKLEFDPEASALKILSWPKETKAINNSYIYLFFSTYIKNKNKK